KTVSEGVRPTCGQKLTVSGKVGSDCTNVVPVEGIDDLPKILNRDCLGRHELSPTSKQELVLGRLIGCDAVLQEVRLACFIRNPRLTDVNSSGASNMVQWPAPLMTTYSEPRIRL